MVESFKFHPKFLTKTNHLGDSTRRPLKRPRSVPFPQAGQPPFLSAGGSACRHCSGPTAESLTSHGTSRDSARCALPAPSTCA